MQHCDNIKAVFVSKDEEMECVFATSILVYRNCIASNRPRLPLRTPREKSLGEVCHSCPCVSPLWSYQVIADLEEEKRRHAEDTAEGDDVTYILEKERERLQQQVLHFFLPFRKK